MLITVFAVAGCDRNEPVAHYEAAKDPPATAPALAPAAQEAGATSGVPFKWEVPAGWKDLGAKDMRAATFQVSAQPPVELTVIPLGKEAGDLTANVNRWEGQLGLPPSPKDQLEKVVRHADVNGLHIDLVDLASPESASPRQRMLAAIVPHAGRVWFFKVQGPHELVSGQKQNFDAFIASLNPVGATDAHAGHDHAGHDHDAHGAASAPVALTIKNFKAPAEWRELPKQEPPRVRAFEIGSGEKKADFVITKFGQNNAGSFLDNINRWRGQVGLAPVADAQQAQMTEIAVGPDGPGVLVEFHNPDNKKRMYVAIASGGADLWFFKMTGPDDVVEGQRKNLEAFMKSLEFAAASEK